MSSECSRVCLFHGRSATNEGIDEGYKYPPSKTSHYCVEYAVITTSGVRTKLSMATKN
jgi:hypothetical protein